MRQTSDLVPNPWNPACSSRELLTLVGDKWTLLLPPKLAVGPERNGELMRALDGVSQKMLTQTLRAMERDGRVIRRDFGEVSPRVEYELTPLGRSLAAPVAALDAWIVQHFCAVEQAQQNYERQSGRLAET